jgi:hypothetical protein
MELERSFRLAGCCPARPTNTRSAHRFVVRNFVCVIDDIRPQASLVETDLFPRGAIEFYTAKNMG